MDQETPLHYRHIGLAQDIICAEEAISGIGDSLDKLNVKRAMVVCGPTILRSSDVVQRVQEALGRYCVRPGRPAVALINL